MARIARTPAHRNYENAVKAREAAVRVGTPADLIDKMKFEERQLAHKVAVSLGHIATRQGRSVECAKCGASGTVGDQLEGAIHKEPCS